MKYSKILLVIMAAVLSMSLTGWAQEGDEDAASIPEMGPPQQIKDLSWLVGTWDCDMQFKMSEGQEEWMPSKGVGVYKYVAGGAAIQSTYTSDGTGGMKFEGIGLETYNRETGKWQTIWVDNMGAYITYYEGDKSDDGRTVMFGDEKFGGQSFKSRVTTYDETPTSFQWQMDSSMDGGETWWTSGKATYTKRK